MSDAELTGAERRLIGYLRHTMPAGDALADLAAVKAAARAEGAREALREAADWLDSDETNPPPEALEPLRQQDWEDGVLVACDWLRARTNALDPATQRDDRPGGCLHGPGARPGLCPNCGTVVSEETSV